MGLLDIMEDTYCYILEVNLEIMDFSVAHEREIEPFPGYLEIWWGIMTPSEATLLQKEEWVNVLEKAVGFESVPKCSGIISNYKELEDFLFFENE